MAVVAAVSYPASLALALLQENELLQVKQKLQQQQQLLHVWIWLAAGEQDASAALQESRLLLQTSNTTAASAAVSALVAEALDAASG
jgi:hypothetical protein